VDAALDNTNVTRVARYLREHSSKTFQFIVISLKECVSTLPLCPSTQSLTSPVPFCSTLYERSNSLVGVYRDQDVNSSKSLTLDLQQYEEA
jgi:structural maintenance of chromosome 1